ncbi:MAG: V-type ATP synthase subunit E family protein [Clostridia bacterium]|nr:V-type ATP synthase subunit E family protein [Clostridia bacterium]
MKADAITARIIEDANLQAERTLAEARVKAEKMQAEFEAELEKKQKDSEAQTEKQISDMRDRMLRMAQLDQKKQMLAVKREVIDMAFEDALERMYKMPADKKREYIKKLIIESAEGGEMVIPSKPDEAVFDEGFMAQVNEAVQKAGKEPLKKSDAARDIDGGFVLSKDGMEINCAYKAVLGQYRSALEAEAAALIFN